MTTVTIELTDSEYKALEFASADPQDYLLNFAKVRASTASDEISKILMDHCNANGIAIAVGSDAQILQAYELGIVKTAAERDAEFLASVTDD